MPKRKAAASAGNGKKNQKVGEPQKRLIDLKNLDYSNFYPAVMEEVFKLVDDEDDRELAAPFIKLPSKKLYPDYFTIVTLPMTIGEIQKKISKNAYLSKSADEIVEDFDQIYKNAALYNDPDLWLVADALFILDYVKEEVEKFSRGEGLTQESFHEGGLGHDNDDNNNGTGHISEDILNELESTEELTNNNLSTVCEALLIATRDHKFPGEGILSNPFLEIVDRREFPDYFKIIAEPMSFNKLLKNLHKKYYFSPKKEAGENLDLFNYHASLIWSNAQSYNDPKSLIYQDSLKLQKYYEEQFEKVKARLPESRSPPKLKLKLGRPRKKVVEEEEVAATTSVDIKAEEESSGSEEESEDGSGDEGSYDDDVQDKEVQETSRDVPVQLEHEYNTYGKTSITPEKTESSFIQLLSLCLNADFSSNSFVQRQQPIYQPLGSLSLGQQTKYSLFPSNNVTQGFTSYEYNFPASGYESELFSLTLPPQSNLLSIFRVALHNAFYELKKGDMFNQGVVDNLDEEFLCNLVVNEVPVTTGGHIYDDISRDNFEDQEGNTLNFQYDIKLAKGVNILSFEVKVGPSLSKKLKNTKADDTEGHGRHTRNQLQQFKMSWEVQKVNFVVVV